MEFLKSAVSSAMSKTPAFPYTFGDRVDVDDRMWTLYNGIRRVRSFLWLGRDSIERNRV